MKKLSISNIAWNPENDTQVASLLEQYHFSGVEIAPTKIWPDLLSVSSSDIRNHKTFWAKRNIEVSAMQSLLYGRPDLCIFTDQENRRETLEYLVKCMEIAEILEAPTLVFGSPKNRSIASCKTDYLTIALDFFYELGVKACQHGMTFCIEANPTNYDCDFIISSNEARELVTSVNQAGFGLHLDAGGMVLSEENIIYEIEQSVDELKHFHISEPFLAPIGAGTASAFPHEHFAETLTRLKYDKWYSVEMRQPDTADYMKTIADSMALVSSTYH